MNQGSRKSRIKLEKAKTINQLKKRRKIQAETFTQQGHKQQDKFNSDKMGDLQDIIGNISDEQDPLSTSLKALISKLRKRNKLIIIADSTKRSWAVVEEYG